MFMMGKLASKHLVAYYRMSERKKYGEHHYFRFNFHQELTFSLKDLMETISGLQKEMAKEQENFNSLSSELKNFKDRNSRQYKQISKDMVASQHRLTLLMNRSIKCFAQVIMFIV